MNPAGPVAVSASGSTTAITPPARSDETAARRVLLAHRSQLGADGLKALIERANLNFQVQTVSSIEQAMRLLAAEAFDLALIAAGQDGAQNYETLCTVAAGRPETPIVLVIPDENAHSIAALIRRGVRGVMLESTPGNTLGAVLQRVMIGGVHVPAVTPGARPEESEIRIAQPDNTHAQWRGALTPRQIEVLRLVARGFSNKAISRALSMQGSTVKAHVNHIMRKLKVRNRTQAALMASQFELADELHF
jgi:DNA-binding NarL/FixJ family response regulator